MNHDFLMGVAISTIAWGAVFLGYIDWNVRKLAELMLHLNGIRELHNRMLKHMWQGLHSRTTRIAYLEDILKTHNVGYSPDPNIFDDPFPDPEETKH